MEGVNKVCALVASSLPLAEDLFSGPAKFPTCKELDESLIAPPAISIDTIQQVAVEACGIPLEEVSRELLLAEHERINTEAEEVSPEAPAQLDG